MRDLRVFFSKKLLFLLYILCFEGRIFVAIVVDSNQIIKTTYPKFVRGSHWLDGGSLFAGRNNYGMFALSSGIQTNWFLSNDKKVIDDFFDTKAINEKIIEPIKSQYLTNVLLATEAQYFIDKTQQLVDLVRKVYVGEIIAYSMLKCIASYENVRFGVEAPIIYHLSHPWADDSTRNSLQQSFDYFLNLSALSDDTASEVKALKSLFMSKKTSSDFGVGDVKFFIEKEIFGGRLENLDVFAGLEAFVCAKKADLIIQGPLSIKRPNKTPSTFFSDVIDGVPNSDAALIDFVQNVLVAMHETKMRSEIDTSRSGFGIYLAPVFRSQNQIFKLFGKAEGVYFFSREKTAVFPVGMFADLSKSYLDALSCSVYTSPLMLFNGQVGVGADYQGFCGGIGYDFYFKCKEDILRIEDTFDHQNNDLVNNLIKEKAETGKSIQHRIIATVGYQREFSENRSAFVSLAGNYNFVSKGTAHNSWGLSLLFGVGF